MTRSKNGPVIMKRTIKLTQLETGWLLSSNAEKCKIVSWISNDCEVESIMEVNIKRFAYYQRNACFKGGKLALAKLINIKYKVLISKNDEHTYVPSNSRCLSYGKVNIIRSRILTLVNNRLAQTQSAMFAFVQTN